MPVVILAGDEEFEISRRVAELKATLLEPSWLTMNFIKLSNPSFVTLAENAASLPFGKGKRIVLIDDCSLFTKKRAKNDDSKTQIDGSSEEAFMSMLTNVSENTYLIFACPYNFDSTLKLSKAASKIAKIEEFPKEKYFPGARAPKLEAWCRNESKRYGATIESEAIQYLLAATEGNLRKLSSEIEKAALSILPLTSITSDVVNNTCSSQGHIFQFVDLWLSGQTGRALNELESLLAQQNSMPVLAALQTMMSKWIKLKALYEQYGNDKAFSSRGQITKQIAAELKLLPFSVDKDLDRLKEQSLSSLLDKRLRLTQLEYSIKVGLVPDSHALALFVLN